MSIHVAAILREALDLWQNPPFTELSREAQIAADEAPPDSKPRTSGAYHSRQRRRAFNTRGNRYV